MYHPNIDEISGSVCLDVINQTWSPMFGMILLSLIYILLFILCTTNNNVLSHSYPFLFQYHRPAQYF